MEKNILENTECLIQCAIASSLLEGEAREKELNRSTGIVYKIVSDLKELIDVKDEHLAGILSQLVSQKLPDAEVQSSLGTLGQELEQILKLGVTALVQRPQEGFEPPTDRFSKLPEINLLPEEYRSELNPEVQEAFASVSRLEEQGSKGLEFSLKSIFPGEELNKVWVLENVEFAFCLPQRKLVCDSGVEGKEELELKQEICSRHGFYYVNLSEQDSKNPRRVQRLLKWSGRV